MGNVVVVFHSGFGHTQRLAQAVADGADADLLPISPDGELSADDWTLLDEADAIVFGSPTYMGGVSWQFKRFADATSKRWNQRTWADKLAGGFTVSSNPSGDKLATLQGLMTLAMQHGMVWVGQALRNDEHHNRLGAGLGVMALAHATESAHAMHAGDLETAHRYGQRVAQWAQRRVDA